MAIATAVLISVLIFFIGAFIYIAFFGNKGRKVIIEFYEEMSNNAWYRIDPDKIYKGRIFRDKDGVEKLKVPKKFSKLSLEAVNINCLTPTNKGFAVVKMVKDAEGLFRSMAVEVIDNKTFRAKVEQREPLAWLLQEHERVKQQYQKKDRWAQLAPLALLGIIIIGGLLVIYSTGQQINELNDDYREQTLGEIKEQKSFVLDLVNNIKGENNNNVETSEDAEKPLGVE